MSWVKNPFHAAKKFISHPLKSLAHLGVDAAGFAIGGPVGLGAAEGGFEAATNGGSIGDILKGAAIGGAGSYVGGQIGSFAGNALGGNLGRSIGDVAFSNLPSNALGSFAGNSIPASIANSSIGSALGGFAGNSIGQQLAAPKPKTSSQLASAPVSGQAPFVPKQQDAQELPASLSGLSGLTSDQQSTNLASQGVYGGGNGPQEQSYFMNLLNRRLVDPSGKTGDVSQVNPIEQSYLQRLGISGYGNTNSLLEAMSKWQAA